MSGDDTASEVVLQARAAREAGEGWRARDLLAEHVENERDLVALTELGDVLNEMGDLPRAGAVWFAAGAKGPQVDAAVAAWREQSHDDFTVMWRSLPASVRMEPRPRRIEALRERALKADAASVAETETDAGSAQHRADGADGADADGAGGADGQDDEDGGGFDANWVVAWVLAVAFVVFAVIGFVTALGWIVPG